ncbi:MAG: transcription-repair coupling factor, partial [Cytophagales bacterium]|nr:transcription-repair coupling factor [Cytophagales bacterium]
KNSNLKVKNLAGSFDAVLAAFLAQSHDSHCLYIMYDKEEAAYYQNDLQNFVNDETVLLFPTSYKKPYQYEETENANILQRAEVLNLLSTSEQPLHIVTYPEALLEKVINKRSLISNTFTASVGEKLDIDFIAELLTEYDFEKTDFVYEPGQFAVRGGIIDVFSFSADFPYRLELFGEEIESIRLFDPETQRSQKDLEKVALIPNVQTQLLQEERQAFLKFFPEESLIWIKDYRNLLDIVQRGFDKVSESFDELMKMSDHTKVISTPEVLFETGQSIERHLEPFQKVEFGKQFYLNGEEVLFQIKPQPHFHKNFNLLAESLHTSQELGFKNHICSESPQQLNRLTAIFEEMDTSAQFNQIVGGLREGFIDEQHEIVCFTDHQIFDRFHRFKTKPKFSKSKSLTLRELKTLQPGDYVVHVDYGVGRFAGMDNVKVGENTQEAIRLVYRDDDLLYVSIHSLHKISKYSGKEGTPPSLNKLGTQDWESKKRKVKGKVKDIAKDLIQLYAKRKNAPGFVFTIDDYLQAELESSFLYQDTPDQGQATVDVKKDMEKTYPMDRLVCGDVGFGKTEIAIRAAFKAVNNGKQVAILVPTTILAMQHYHTFTERLKEFPVSTDYINRFKTTKQITEIKKGVKSGKIDILIGTHRIVNKDIEFKDLGLMVIDEEQKFGVKVKEKLKEMKVNVDSLTLTATPIPRTLHFSLMGARDLSIISTPPPNRRPVTTEALEFNNEIIRDAVSNEIRRGGQVFFVHNRISDIEQIGNLVHQLVPDAKIIIGHGQMEGPKLEKVMMKFINGECDVLISTNIIESGLDIPNANTIIINRAHMFGLSDLHQMRGRVGRSNTKAYCYLLTPPGSTLNSDSRKRLIALEEFSDLGDGFKVAMRDLDIRGAGNLLGSEQSGFITDMGFEMYHKILDEAVAELKEQEFKDLFETTEIENARQLIQDCIVETDLEIRITEEYISDISERLSTYTALDNLKNENELGSCVAMLKDRFGPLPESLDNLIESVRLRWLAIELGFEKVIIKNELMKCYIPSRDQDYFQSDVFGGILSFVQSHPRQSSMKELKERLVISVHEVSSIERAIGAMREMASPMVQNIRQQTQ